MATTLFHSSNLANFKDMNNLIIKSTHLTQPSDLELVQSFTLIKGIINLYKIMEKKMSY